MNDIRKDVERAYDEIQATKDREEELGEFLGRLYDTHDPERDEFLEHLFRLYKRTEPLWGFFGLAAVLAMVAA